MNAAPENSKYQIPEVMREITRDTKMEIYLTPKKATPGFYNNVDTFKVVLKFNGRQLTHYIHIPQNFNERLLLIFVLEVLCNEANSYHFVRDFNQFAKNYEFTSKEEAESAYKSASKIHQNLIRLYGIHKANQLLSYFR